VIEHNLEVIKTADWVIDLGPDGGDEIVAWGSPEVSSRRRGVIRGSFWRRCWRSTGSGSGGRARRRSKVSRVKKLRCNFHEFVELPHADASAAAISGQPTFGRLTSGATQASSTLGQARIIST
jgi:hypothetical protein